MDITELFQPGMINEQEYHVGDEQTAAHIGSGAHRVLATPWMITFMERAARDLLAKRLPEGFSSVGVQVNVRHLAPTPVGSRVRVRAEVLQVDGVKVTFKVNAWDETEQIGAGEHTRVVIEAARFLKRVEKKQ